MVNWLNQSVARANQPAEGGLISRLKLYGRDNPLLRVRIEQKSILVEIRAKPCGLGLGIARKNSDWRVAFSQVLAWVDVQRVSDKGCFAAIRIAFFGSNG